MRNGVGFVESPIPTRSAAGTTRTRMVEPLRLTIQHVDE